MGKPEKKINIKLRHFPGTLPRRIQIGILENNLENNPNAGSFRTNCKRSKHYKDIMRMNEKARVKELVKKEINNEMEY